MEISSTYDPKNTEDKWYRYWNDNGFFHSEPDERPPYTIVIPPPNVTGVLHMGHMLNNTIQDVLIRRARMLGYNACWVPGTDHASIATEAKVVAKLKAEGIEKRDLTREEFLVHAWEWKEKHGDIILGQLKKLGASCDWERTRFTMEEELSEAVTEIFIKLYEKGLIYRGFRMVNWDPQALTTVSDEEVIYREERSKLYHVRYQIEGTDDEWITIATTRPETILGDSAICIHPEDERYTHMKGKRAIVPVAERSIPIIFDEYVDKEFGTGCLKITPAHDPNDYVLGKKHQLETIDILNANATLNAHGLKYEGMDRFKARKAIARDLEESGHLVAEEDYTNNVGTSERTGVVIEPRLSDQWYCDMKEMAKPALDEVENDNIRLYPKKFKNTYRHWMSNVQDWCISRQLWWGHRIPAYYYGTGREDFVVATDLEQAVEKARAKSGNDGLTANDLKQDEDALDTWFSSWLWPISVFDGFKDPNNADIQYYYPTNTLVTGPDILFFWVARMVMAGFEFKGEKPFSDVYLTGMVRDALGRKMSKQLGNSPDAIKLMDKYSADGVRMGMLLSSAAGNDLIFDAVQVDEEDQKLTKKEIKEWDEAGKERIFISDLCRQGANFNNKVWNALRLVKSFEVDESLEMPEENKLAIEWLEHKLDEVIKSTDIHFTRYRISDALMNTYKYVKDDFCSWYLEIIKPAYQQPIDRATYEATLDYFEKALKVLHPFMPFVTEEVWHSLRDRKEKESLMMTLWPTCGEPDKKLLSDFEAATEVVSNIRAIRTKNGLSPHKELTLVAKGNANGEKRYDLVITKLGKLESIEYSDDAPANAQSFMVGADEFYIPLELEIDVAAETEKLEADLKYQEGFLNSVMKKLGNERFVANANPAVVESERKKQSDAEAKIKVLREQLSALASS